MHATHVDSEYNNKIKCSEAHHGDKCIKLIAIILYYIFLTKSHTVMKMY